MNFDHNKIQRELDRLMMEKGIYDNGDKRWAPILTWRILLGILSILGLAVMARLVQILGL